MALNLDQIDLGGFGIGDNTAEDQDNQLKATMGQALTVNPDSQAKIKQLSSDTGVPEFAVEGAEAELETGLKLDNIDFSGMSKRTPGTAKFLMDYDNASIAHDDISIMQSFETIFNFKKTFGNFAESNKQSFNAQATGLIAAGIDRTPSRIQDLIPMGAMPIGMESDAIFLSEEYAANLGITTDEQLQQAKEEAVDQITTRLRDISKKRKELAPKDLNLLEQGVRGGFDSLVSTAPGVALMALSGGRAAPLLATMGVQSYGEAYGEAKAEGLSTEKAQWFASINAAIEVGTEMLPVGTLQRIITGKTDDKMTKAMMKFAVQEMGTEQLATLGQTITSYGFGLDEELENAETTGEKIQIQLRRQAVTAIATIVAGGAQAAAVSGVRKTIDKISTASKEQTETGDIEQRNLDKIDSLANESNLKGRSLNSFRQFIAEADGDNSTTVFIDAVQASLYLREKSTEEIQANPGLKLLQEEVGEAAALGTSVGIPIQDFATDIAGTDTFTELRDSMTMSDTTAAPFQQQQIQTETKNYVNTLLVEADDSVSQYVEAQEIYETVKQQLIDTGQVNSTNAGFMARVVPAWAMAQAKRSGRSVKEVFDESGLLIEGPQTGERARLEGELDLLKQSTTNFTSTTGDTTVDERLSEVVQMTPDEYLRKAFEATSGRLGGTFESWMESNTVSQETRDGYADAFEKGEKFPLPYIDNDQGSQDGRNRAMAAKQAGIENIPVGIVNEPTAEVELARIKEDLKTAKGYRAAKLNRRLDTLLSPTTLQTQITSEFDGVDLSITGKGDAVTLNKIVVPEDQQGTGVGTSVMQRVTDWADQNGKRIALTPSKDFGGTVKRLKEFYKRQGFVENKGKNKDFEISESMYRDPVKLEQFEQPLVVDQDLANDLLSEIAEFSEVNNGVVTVYHRTSKENADRIRESGNIIPKEDGVFFSTKRDGEAIGFGDEVIEFKIPADQLTLDDIFDDEAHVKIKATANRSTDISQLLAQPTSEDAPGARGYYDPTNSIIRLTEAADLSTFLHEFGHFMYEMELKSDSDIANSMGNWFKRNSTDVAKEANSYLTPEKFDAEKQDSDTPVNINITEEDVATYIDSKTTGDTDKDSAIRRAVHEQLARGFESYLMEGKAPSIELRNAFRTFARWLGQIYQAMRGQLNVNLDNEMREVFDRLLATEEQIAAAEARVRVEPLFTNATMAGMTEEEFSDYQKRQSKVKDKQSETLRDKLIKQLTRQTKDWWNDEKQSIIDDQKETIGAERVHVTRNALKTGDIKLDFAVTKAMVGETKTDKLGRKSVRIPTALRGMTLKNEEGFHPDEVAALMGYESGSEMIDDIISAPSLDDAAKSAAEAEMIKRHGDILNDGTIEREADDAVQSEERGKLLLHELKMLARGTVAPTVDRTTIREIARERIGKLSYRQIFPGKYRTAEIKAAQESAKMLAEGNKEGAAAAKLRQVTNFYLGKEATEARDQTDKIVTGMNRYNKKKVKIAIMKSDGGHWEQIVKILERFEFRKSASLKGVEALNEDINTWAANRMEVEGDGLVLSNAVLNELFVTHWKNVPFSDLKGVSDSVKNIEHVARYSNKMALLEEEVEFKTLRANWVDHIGIQEQRFDIKETRSRFDDSRDSTAMEHVRRWASQLTKVPFLASWLDGGERVGMSHQILVQPLTNALDAKFNLIKEIVDPVTTSIASRTKEDKKRHARKIWIPEIKDTLSGSQILAVALNVGNEGNLRKLLLGEQWADPEVDSQINISNPKLQAVLANMSESDWKLVQLIWDQMELLYDPLAEVHFKTTGIRPPKVKEVAVQTPFGELRGGYYPVKYSTKRGHKAEKNAEKSDAEADSMFNNQASIQASVNASATSERTGFYAPVMLDLNVVPEHFNEVTHFITHHDAVRQINRLINSDSVADAITGVLGDSEFKQLKPWLNDVAKDGRGQPVKTFIDEAFGRLRFGVTLGAMGFKASTGIMQFFGLMTTAAELGVGPTVKGIYTVVGKSWYMRAVRRTLGSRDDMQTTWEFASERSKVLPHRTQTMDREIRNAMTRLKGKSGFVAATQEVSMKHIALIQTYMVDLPTWMAAYDKRISETGDEGEAIRFADVSIESLQGSGATKDMATLLRSQSKIHTTFTMFMTFFSSLGNLSRDLVKGSRTGLYSKTDIAAKTMFLFTLPVFFEMLMRGDFDEPEDEDDRLQKYLTGVALYPVASIPFVRDVASGVLGDYGYNQSPVSALLERGIAGSKGLMTAGLTDKEVTKAQLKNVSKLAAAAVGLPGINQAWATGEHLYDVFEEGEDFTVREGLFGPDRK